MFATASQQSLRVLLPNNRGGIEQKFVDSAAIFLLETGGACCYFTIIRFTVLPVFTM